MGKLATLPFIIGRKYEISQGFEVFNPAEIETGYKTNTQVFDVKNQQDLNLLNHHWNQLNESTKYSGSKVLPPVDITDDKKVEILKDIKKEVELILKKDDVLSDNKVKEYTIKIMQMLISKRSQLKLDL